MATADVRTVGWWHRCLRRNSRRSVRRDYCNANGARKCCGDAVGIREGRRTRRHAIARRKAERTEKRDSQNNDAGHDPVVVQQAVVSS
jgi:hypothetical protein